MENLRIKNFGPIKEIEITIKPFTIFIGESGSGKSVILKLLSLCRFICKKSNLKEMAKRLKVKDYCRLRTEKLLRDSGLDDFMQPSTFIEYKTEYETVVISMKNNPKHKHQFTHFIPRLEKTSFITDDRFTIVMILNNQIRGSFPYHLQKTYEDFEEAFDHYNLNNKTLKIATIDIELSKEKFGISKRFYIKKEKSKTQFHNVSSGMKSLAIIEPILSYFSKIYMNEEYMQKQLRNFLFDLYIKSMNNNSMINILKDNLPFPNPIQNPRLNLFIEEPELSLFPTMQKKLVEYLSMIFNSKPNIHIAFSTHSPYILSSLNCLLKAHAISEKVKDKTQIEAILPKKSWLSLENFAAYKVADGTTKSLIDQETNLILANEIDEVSEEIGDTFDKLLDLEFHESNL